MSLFFFDGFDFTNGNEYGPGGRLWDQGSSASDQAGRWGGGAISPSGSGNLFIGEFGGLFKKFTSRAGVVLGVAARFDSFTAEFGTLAQPFIFFGDLQSTGETIQCSLWVDPNTFAITLRTGRGDQITDTTLATTNYIPPLTLWFYLEIKLTIGNPGSVEIRIDGTDVVLATGIQTQQSPNPTWNVIHLSAMDAFGPTWVADDFYLVDPNDGQGSTDFLGEVRVQTHFPDADGYQNNFLRSTGSINATNVAQAVSYTDDGLYNYSGNVNDIDLYSITPFAITGQVFGVQENMSVRKDNTGSRSVCPLMRIGATNFQGPSFICFSSFTYMGDIWEYNPLTSAPWVLADLNSTQFGIQITA